MYCISVQTFHCINLALFGGERVKGDGRRAMACRRLSSKERLEVVGRGYWSCEGMKAEKEKKNREQSKER